MHKDAYDSHDVPDLDPPPSKRAHRDRKQDKAFVIECAWGYLDKYPSGLQLDALVAALDEDTGFHPKTLLVYLRSKASISSTADFDISKVDGVDWIRGRRSAIRRRAAENAKKSSNQPPRPQSPRKAQEGGDNA